MLRAKDYRKAAWSALSGKWGTFALIGLIYVIISGCCTGLNYFYGVGSIIQILLRGPLAVGLAFAALNVANGAAIKVEDLFAGFKNYGRTFLLGLINLIFVTLWTLLLIVPGIIKSLSYSMSYYILIEDPEISSNDARKKSMEIMKGHKWRLFCLSFSFIGWYILGILTLGILLFWVVPYVHTARAKFYNDIKPVQQNVTESVIPEQQSVSETTTAEQ